MEAIKLWMAKVFFPDEKNLCVDESILPYFGRYRGKQHMQGKPIRFGYKTWCLFTRLGYLIQSILYQGEKTGNTDSEVGVGESIVLNLVSKLPVTNDIYIYILIIFLLVFQYYKNCVDSVWCESDF